jgi:hypothetical protein
MPKQTWVGKNLSLASVESNIQSDDNYDLKHNTSRVLPEEVDETN